MTPNKKKKVAGSSVRLNKYLADKGIATRRSADELIKKGLVFINGKKANLGDFVNEGDNVNAEKPKESDRLVYYAYNKPIGVTTVGKQPGEKEIKDVTKFPIPVFPVGRLDKDSSGLIIMTNDGRITKKLLDPEYEHEKEYLVEVNKPVDHLFMVRLRDGVRLGRGEMTKKAKVRKVEPRKFEIIITEGKNRQIRRMCSAFNYEVKKLTRIRVMNILLGKLKPGQLRELKGKELVDFLKEVL